MIGFVSFFMHDTILFYGDCPCVYNNIVIIRIDILNSILLHLNHILVKLVVFI